MDFFCTFAYMNIQEYNKLLKDNIKELFITEAHIALFYFGALFYQIKGVAIASIISSFFQVASYIVVYLIVSRKYINRTRKL